MLALNFAKIALNFGQNIPNLRPNFLPNSYRDVCICTLDEKSNMLQALVCKSKLSHALGLVKDSTMFFLWEKKV